MPLAETVMRCIFTEGIRYAMTVLEIEEFCTANLHAERMFHTIVYKECTGKVILRTRTNACLLDSY